MLGIGLPEMLVILAVALIVVGPDKLPDMARTVAKWAFELKKTVNQVKDSLADEDNLIGSVHKDIKQTGDELKEKLLESDHFTWHEGGGPKNIEDNDTEDVADVYPDEQVQTDAKEADIPDDEQEDKT